MRRKLVSLGLFAASVCSGRAIADTRVKEIYTALKEIGFQETRWQIIFDGQTGGLVFPYNEGLNEIHVRFFEDRIFAELEFSRASIFHFIFPLFNANGFLSELLKDRIKPSTFEFLLEKLSSNLRDDELERPEWRHTSEDDPYRPMCGTHWRRLGLYLHKRVGWRALVALSGLSFPITLPAHGAPYLSLGRLLITVVSIRFIPSIGRP